MRPTVHDIAAEAGVSLATVDRVLNARAGVRSETRLRVQAAVERLGYVRDVAAANLAKSRIYPIRFILPSGDNPFMRALEAHVRQVGNPALRPGGLERVAVSLDCVPPLDAPALAAALIKAGEDEPAGIAVVAVEAPEVAAAVRTLQARGIPVATLVSDLPASGRNHFAGIDNMAAGRTAGGLMRRFLSGSRGAVAVIAGSLSLRDHRERLDGFAQALREAGEGLTLLPVLEGEDDPAKVEALAKRLLAEQPDLAGIYSLGAGDRGLVRALAQTKMPRPQAVVVHELSDHTRQALEEGLVDAVLAQDPGHIARSAVRVLRAFADGLVFDPAQERIRIDIFLKDNLPPARQALSDPHLPTGE
ncbi:LacI family transcriptional regulator [Xaviernesmea oryzae]|uniref:LacI family transcriptional regulator n=1 Tax=Xaviernesmea oryzae TaxID=464029 RepID=A0A1Q9AZ45_9HYPH|nr:LacI family DNA-binding transcriptional regulator [Xaviernesmea oryzae]OLP60977.1 LacI family transcriptional regulator [Xaviernesmea oryzae]SEL19222.1 LacI family transcriptional regulator [Xaviernesmea oryzae]